jgi:hypothetical protein
VNGLAARLAKSLVVPLFLKRTKDQGFSPISIMFRAFTRRWTLDWRGDGNSRAVSKPFFAARSLGARQPTTENIPRFRPGLFRRCQRDPRPR